MMIVRRVTWGCLALAALAAGCGDSLQPRVTTRVDYDYSNTYHFSRRLDVLFVIDDTAAMAPHREALAAALPAIAQTLRVPSLQSVHVGFIRAGSCDTSTRGSACGVAGEQFLRSEWCHTIDNFSGGWEETFACLGDLGVASCAPSQPLAAAQRFLTGAPLPGWEGFWRADAHLVIVIVTAQDDASGPPDALTPVLEIAAAIKATTGDPYRFSVSVIGPGGDCAAGEQPGPRLLDFVEEFGATGLYLPQCGGEFTRLVQRFGEVSNIGIPRACVSNVRDIDPATPGLQPDCSVEDLARTPGGTRTASRLPSCDESTPPCWRLTPEGACGGYSLSIERAADFCAESGLAGTIECLACADPGDPACNPPGA
jgi:hypothetical protein